LAYLVEKNGKQYCIEEDGTEWEYSPAIPMPSHGPDRITQLEIESAMLTLELVDMQIRLDQAESERSSKSWRRGVSRWIGSQR